MKSYSVIVARRVAGIMLMMSCCVISGHRGAGRVIKRSCCVISPSKVVMRALRSSCDISVVEVAGMTIKKRMNFYFVSGRRVAGVGTKLLVANGFSQPQGRVEGAKE